MCLHNVPSLTHIDFNESTIKQFKSFPRFIEDKAKFWMLYLLYIALKIKTEHDQEL